MGKYLKNVWYMGAWSSEIDDKFLSRTILETPVVFFRDPEGKASALMDMCPHRFAPLSAGKMTPKGLQCKYHGLTFDNTGKCVDNPLGGPTPTACRVASYPVFEKDSILWIWMGDPETADIAKVPDFPMLNNPDMRIVRGYSPGKAHYQLYVDNLLDLTHANFLHPAFGYDSPKNTMEQVDNDVISRYKVENVPNPPLPGMIWSSNGKNVDLWDDIRWTAPATLYLESLVNITGEPKDDAFCSRSAHVMTPETESSTHYFWASDIPKDNPMPSELFESLFHDAFDLEDRPMIESVQQRMGGRDFWEMKPVLLGTDGAPVRARRIMDTLLKLEQE